MGKKYEITQEYKKYSGRIMYRIRALKSFSDVKRGDIGGWIAKESNLSQYGTSWVYGDAQVYGNARVDDNACISGIAQVYGNALVYSNPSVSMNAQVYGNASVCGYASISDSARIFGCAHVSGDARIFGCAHVSGDAKVYGRACVYDDAVVSGDASISGNTEVYESWDIQHGTWHRKFSKNDLVIAQTNIAPINGLILCFKKVRKIKNGEYKDLYSGKFVYQDGKICREPKTEKSDRSCAPGLHFSTATYWDGSETDIVLIACWVRLDRVVTVQQGKIRASECKVIGECK